MFAISITYDMLKTISVFEEKGIVFLVITAAFYFIIMSGFGVGSRILGKRRFDLCAW